MKQFVKNTFAYDMFLFLRKYLRIIYSVKSRNRFFWNLRRGDDILSLNYELTKDSTVFVVGAFKGDYLGKVHDKFKCIIYGFEPVSEYFRILEDNFKNFKNIKLFNIGLSNKTEKAKIDIKGESSSIYSNSDNLIDINLKSTNEFLSEHEISEIDLVYMNIEGEEYAVLKELIDSGNIKKIKHLQVQYHKINKDSKKDRKTLNKLLCKTHIQKFNYPFIWERWDLKG